jgi:hypothetical protein
MIAILVEEGGKEIERKIDMKEDLGSFRLGCLDLHLCSTIYQHFCILIYLTFLGFHILIEEIRVFIWIKALCMIHLIECMTDNKHSVNTV